MRYITLKNNWLIVILLGLLLLFYHCQKVETALQQETIITQNDTITDSYLLYADSLKTQSQYQKAIMILDSAKTIALQKEDWSLYTAYGVKQCVIYDNISDSLKRNCAIHTLEIAEDKLDSQNVQLGLILKQMAEVHLLYEQFDSSIFYYDKSIKILEHNQKWLEYAWAIITKSVNYYYLEDYVSFQKDLIQAQTIYKKYNLESEIYITTLDLLALAYDANGDFNKAIENTENSIQFYLNKSPIVTKDSFFIADNYFNLGAFYSKIGAFQKAYNCNIQSTKYCPDQLCKLQVLKAISIDAYRTMNYDKSITYGQQYLQLIKQIPQNKQAKEYGIIYNHLGVSFMEINQFDSSEIYLKKALKNTTNTPLSISKMNYSALLLEQHKATQALEILNNISEKQFLGSNLKAGLNRKLGRAYAQKRDFDNAMFYFQKSLHHYIPHFVDTLNPYANPTYFGTIKNPIHLLKSLKYKAYHLSQFSEKQKNLEAALATYDVDFQWVDTLLQAYSYDDSRIINNQRNQEIYEQAIEVAHQLYQRTNDKKYINKAFDYAEKVKSNILLSDLQTNDNQTIIPRTIQDREKELTANVAFYERQLQLVKSNKETDKVEMYQNYLTDFSIDLDDLRDSIKDNYPKYYDLKYSAALATISTIQTDLENNQGFISY
ncbi:MAG: hypothetical protein AB8G11_07320, partial [Saprospiraceae bacterium]